MGNIVHIDGRMDSSKEQQILEANITVIQDIEVEQDNDPKHTSKSTIDLVQEWNGLQSPPELEVFSKKK